LAEAGGICISGSVYDHVKNKLTLAHEDLGLETLKNVREPVRVYREKNWRALRQEEITEEVEVILPTAPMTRAPVSRGTRS
jgi:class 3 adenylate cyclase